MAFDPTSAPRPGPRDSRGSDRKPVRMGKFEVVKHVATGGMGAVYKARDTEADRDVALKVLPRELAEKPAMVERFRREARSAAKLRHENIVTLYEAGEYQGTFYLVMEFVEGVDLYLQVQRHGPLAGEEARLVVLQGARGLRHAHEMGIVHRDIKPSNFLLRWDAGRPVVKLLDFGLAREVDDDQCRVTKAGTTVGTIDYMPPEQARDSGTADIRSDLYSLGATWFYLLTGQPLFPRGGVGERLLKLMQEEPPDLRDLNPAVSDETWDVVRRLLAKDPARRYQDPGELIEALHTLEGHTDADPTRPRAKPKRRRGPSSLAEAPAGPDRQRVWYALAGAAALLLLGVVAVAMSMPRRPPPIDPEEPSPPLAAIQPLPGDLPALQPLNNNGLLSWPPRAPEKPTGLRRLPGGGPVDTKSLREEVERPWAAPGAAADPLTVRVARAGARSPVAFRSLAEACRAGTADQPLVVEVHDNGPLFEPAVEAIQRRDLTIKAGPGYRPLIVWDLRATRKSGGPHTFLAVRGGKLSLEGVELALRWPEGLPGASTVLDVEGGELSVRDCTLSVGGKPADGVTLARFAAGREGARCRFTRCHARGADVTALALDGPAEALLDGCLVVGGRRPLLRVRGGEKAANLRVVRSTLVGGPSLVELTPAAAPFSFQGWDSLLSGHGALFDAGGPMTRDVRWRAANCLYAGWKHPVVSDVGDFAVADPWPEQAYLKPGTLPAATYQPSGSVLYAASVAPNEPLGCDLAALPASRDTWVSLAFEPALVVPELPSDDSAPMIPADEETLYAGQEIDATTTDLGAALAKVRRFAPRVVLHLKGSGEAVTSPIRLKGVSLTLHFEEPPDKDTPPLALTLGRASSPVPLIDLDGGSLDVIGGVLRVPDLPTQKASHVVRVCGGDVQLPDAGRGQAGAGELHRGGIGGHSSGRPATDEGGLWRPTL
ncbi:MAG: serine/threonine-protein kinase [Gemmataceae bacterium]